MSALRLFKTFKTRIHHEGTKGLDTYTLKHRDLRPLVVKLFSPRPPCLCGE
jgi:hypothetical protein